MTDGKSKSVALTEVSLILSAVFWGSNFAATKYAAELIPPFLLVALRFAGGGLLLYIILRILEPASKLGQRDLVSMAVLGCFGGNRTDLLHLRGEPHERR